MVGDYGMDSLTSIFKFFHTPSIVGPTIAHVLATGTSKSTFSNKESHTSYEVSELEDGGVKRTDNNKSTSETGKALMTTEEVQEGRVNLSAYWYYCSAGGWFWAGLVLSCLICSQFFQVYASKLF